MSDQFSTLVALASIVVAAIAALYTLRQSQISKKSLQLAQIQAGRHQPKLQLYLIESYIKSYLKERLRLYVFELNISNVSDSPTSIKEISFKIEFSRNEKVVSNIILLHKSSPKLVGVSLFQIPQLIAAHETIKGHAVFQVPYETFQNSSIESYLLKVKDSHDLEAFIEPIFINEVKGE